MILTGIEIKNRNPMLPSHLTKDIIDSREYEYKLTGQTCKNGAEGCKFKIIPTTKEFQENSKKKIKDARIQELKELLPNKREIVDIMTTQELEVYRTEQLEFKNLLGL